MKPEAITRCVRAPNSEAGSRGFFLDADSRGSHRSQRDAGFARISRISTGRGIRADLTDLNGTRIRADLTDLNGTRIRADLTDLNGTRIRANLTDLNGARDSRGSHGSQRDLDSRESHRSQRDGIRADLTDFEVDWRRSH
jgi:hypothetical protein